MFNFRAARWAFLLSGVCVANSALAGAGDLAASVVALTDPVTYSDPNAAPPLKTYVAYTVKLTNNTPNTINNVVLRFSLDGFTAPVPPTVPSVLVPNPALVDGPGSQLPAGCVVSTPTTIDCTIGQMRGNSSFPATGALVPLYVAPVKLSGVVKLTSNLRVVYAESLNGSNPSPNSAIDIGRIDVALGTDNPVSIKSGLPKSGGSLRTGAGGVPDNSTVAAEVVTVPTGSSFAKVSVDVAQEACTQTHFISCPAFTTSVRDPLATTVEARVFPANSPLKLTYRVHPSNLKMTAAKALNSVLIYYTSDEGVTTQVVDICPTATSATGTDKPCFASPPFYYKRSTPGWTLALDGVLEWNFNNTKNGLLKLD